MLKKIKSYHNNVINIGLEHVSIEFEKRSVRSLNFICIYGSILILPIALIKNIAENNFVIVFLILVTIALNMLVVYLNAIGKSQISYLLFSFCINSLGYVTIYVEANQLEVPFLILVIGLVSIFLTKNSFWKLLSFGYSFITFSILFYIQLGQKEFSVASFLLTLIAILIFALTLRFVTNLRNKAEKTILKQNEKLKVQNEVIKTKSEQLLQLEKEKYEQELLLKQKDMEMVLTNNQVQTQLNDNIIDKLKSAQETGDLHRQINQVILELHNQNEINTRMKLVEQNLDIVNSSFFDNLSKIHPHLTRVDKEFCSYLLIGLSSKEISIIRNTTVNTVNVTKTRLRKKLNIGSNLSIVSYLKSI